MYVGHSSSAIAFSNRAMAYLKTKEFKRADADATVALSIDPRHVKVYMFVLLEQSRPYISPLMTRCSMYA